MGTTPYAEVFIDTHEDNERYAFVGVLENLDKTKVGQKLGNLPIYWSDDIGKLSATHAVICPLATTHRKQWIEELRTRGFELASLIHPFTCVSTKTRLKSGAIIDPGVVVAAFTRIGTAVRIGRNASTGHHAEIGDFTTIHPAASISSSCRIGSQTIICSGAVIIEGITIGDGAFVAAGSVVTKNVPPRALVRGNPARIIKEVYGPR